MSYLASFTGVCVNLTHFLKTKNRIYQYCAQLCGETYVFTFNNIYQ